MDQKALAAIRQARKRERDREQRLDQQTAAMAREQIPAEYRAEFEASVNKVRESKRRRISRLLETPSTSASGSGKGLRPEGRPRVYCGRSFREFASFLNANVRRSRQPGLRLPQAKLSRKSNQVARGRIGG